MTTRRVLAALALGFGLGMTGLASAQESVAAAEGYAPIPAPPGPYVSSRPYLGGEQGMSYHGAMQFPFDFHARPYFGPGRYWAPSDGEQRFHREHLATRPMPPWGAPRYDGEPENPGNEKAEPSTQARQPSMPHRLPMWWQPPAGR